MDISTAVKEGRQKLGLTQSELAAKSGVARLTIARIESGARLGLHSTTLTGLADALGLSLDELVGRKPPRAKRSAKGGAR